MVDVGTSLQQLKERFECTVQAVEHTVSTARSVVGESEDVRSQLDRFQLDRFQLDDDAWQSMYAAAAANPAPERRGGTKRRGTYALR